MFKKVNRGKQYQRETLIQRCGRAYIMWSPSPRFFGCSGAAGAGLLRLSLEGLIHGHKPLLCAPQDASQDGDEQPGEALACRRAGGQARRAGVPLLTGFIAACRPRWLRSSSTLTVHEARAAAAACRLQLEKMLPRKEAQGQRATPAQLLAGLHCSRGRQAGAEVK